MTELGHGSNVQGLGTTAVYDKATQEFVINTPRRTDRKWWIGNSQNAKNAVVFAQLWTEGKCHGVHAFIVNLRPKDSDATNPGITIGDCGDKMGLNGVDNGWMEFKDVRVPRADLLNKFGDVKPDGTYTTPIKSDMKRFGLQLAALTLGRISLTAGSNNMLKTALTIAIRYSATRKQFGPPGKPEQSILEFTSQQRRLMPRLANCYANIFVCQYTTKLYSEADRSDKKVIQEIHSLSAGTKALASWATQEAIQVCRECCGGQGYAAYNRFAALKNDHDIFQTFEGDNTVLMQQVAKDLVTQFQKQFIGNEFTGAFKYLTKQMRLVFMQRNPVTTYLTSWKHLMRQDFQLQAFEFRAARLLQAGAFRLRNKLAKANGDMFTAWNQCLPELLHLAKAHVERVVLKKFIKAVKDCPDPETQKVLKLLCDLYALTRIEEDIGVFRNHEYIKTNKANAISKLVTALCQELSKHAVALVDAFEIPDHLLLAPLALKEGDPLENTLAFVEQRYETYPKL
ncbi:Acyl-coenzyme A oxidase, variant 2 [Balamuthia mandrillaris]